MWPNLITVSCVNICLSPPSGEFDAFVDVQMGFVFFEKRFSFLNSPFS